MAPSLKNRKVPPSVQLDPQAGKTKDQAHKPQQKGLNSLLTEVGVALWNTTLSRRLMWPVTLLDHKCLRNMRRMARRPPEGAGRVGRAAASYSDGGPINEPTVRSDPLYRYRASSSRSARGSAPFQSRQGKRRP